MTTAYALGIRLSFRLMLTVEMLRDFTSIQSDFNITNTLQRITQSAPEPPFPVPSQAPLKISSDLRELHKWSLAFRGEQLLHLLHISYATETKLTPKKSYGACLTTDVFINLLTAAVTADRTAPVEPTATFLDHQASLCRVTTPATHHLAAISAVDGSIAQSPGCTRRPRAFVGVTEVRRSLDEDEFWRTRSTADGRTLRNFCSLKQQKTGRTLEACPWTAFTYQRHLLYTNINNEVYQQS